ncbi:MAG: thiamine diphosphokinase [Erysipelotrichaceae bacterium]|nr:thiamine diphosphokinase [Erysipelotrichaceae bacterium]
MSECIVCLTLTSRIPDGSCDLIGVDRGALVLAKNGKRMKLSVGDFDSVDEKDLSLIREYSDEMIRLNPIKDDSDSESAIRLLVSRGYQKITLLGGLGGRVDHEIVNLKLAEEFAGHIWLKNDQNLITVLKEGTYEIDPEGYRYISFFAVMPSVITLEQMKYPLNERMLYPGDLYALSNEITGEKGIVRIGSGKVLMIQSDDKK